MSTGLLIVLTHQLLFQGVFVGKNLYLKRKLGRPVRGNNPEAVISIVYFAFLIFSAMLLAMESSVAGLPLVIALLLMILSLGVAIASLIDLGDSWRVGIISEQTTKLVEEGIYSYSRNPYFLSYLLMFASYTVLLQSSYLLIVSIFGFLLIHRMVIKEEQFLASTHGEQYRKYQQRVPRYLIF